MLSAWMILGLLACVRSGESEPPPAPAVEKASPSQRPVVDSPQLAPHGGAVIRLVGVYRPQLTLKKQPRPGQPEERVDLGYVSIELAGDTTVLVELGDEPRHEEERAALAGKRVEATGRLLLDPNAGQSGARTMPRPRLVEIEAVVPLE